MKYPNLYIARREARLNSMQTAAAIGIHRVTYSRKECGKLEFTLPEAIALSDLLQKPMDHLFRKGAN